MATKFTAGQLVRVIDISSLAYGRVAMVMGGGQLTQAKLRFVDLPRLVEPTDDSHTGVIAVETFNNDQLEAVEGIPIAPFYAVGEIYEHNEEREYSHYCLAHGQPGQLDAVADEIARGWYSSGGEWSNSEDAYVFDDFTQAYPQGWREISLAEYIQFRQVLPDCTPGH